MFPKSQRIQPGPGQESVWDYPRPPRLEKVCDRLRVTFMDETIAETDRGFRVLETSHPPVYYFPPADVRRDFLIPATGSSFCEFKGMAQYWSIDINGVMAEKAAWSYPSPTYGCVHSQISWLFMPLASMRAGSGSMTATGYAANPSAEGVVATAACQGPRYQQILCERQPSNPYSGRSRSRH